MAARLARMAASMAAGAARTAVAASSRAQSQAAAPSLRLAPVCASSLRALRAPLQSTMGMSLRSFSLAASASASPSATSSNVIDVVKEELDYEKENYTKPEMSSLPEGWSLTERPGDSKVSLMREYNGEVVQVDFVAPEYDEDDDLEFENEDEKEPAEGDGDVTYPPDEISIEVAVMKENSDTALVFEAETNGDYLRILDVSLEPISSGAAAEGEEGDENEDEEPDEDTSYGGPIFTQLDDKLQQAFVDYLAERGVTAELGTFIIEYSADKEQREYMHWLEGVHGFLKS